MGRTSADARSAHGGSGLHIAAQEGNAELARLLLEHRADPNACEVKACGGKSPPPWGCRGVLEVLFVSGFQQWLCCLNFSTDCVVVICEVNACGSKLASRGLLRELGAVGCRTSARNAHQASELWIVLCLE